MSNWELLLAYFTTRLNEPSAARLVFTLTRAQPADIATAQNIRGRVRRMIALYLYSPNNLKYVSYRSCAIRFWFTACLIPQLGSCECVQSENLQAWPANSGKYHASSNGSIFVRPKLRMPGVS